MTVFVRLGFFTPPRRYREVAMARTEGLYQWTELVTRRFPELSPSQCRALAWYSFGMVLAHASGLTVVALELAIVLGRPINTVRQRLRELYQPARVKSGQHRRELDVKRCFPSLVRWITWGWTDRRLVLALDPTSVADRFIVLTVSVVCGGCAIPVAWHVIRADQTGGWNKHWKRLLLQVKKALGDGWELLVLTDRGLESRTLFQIIVQSGGHPLMRVKAYGTFRPDGWHRHYSMTQFAPEMGRRWRGRGVLYQRDAQLPCTLLACWDDQQAEAWLLITDLEPEAANPAWYAFRAWIEQGFKVIKSGGWQWQRSRVTDPKRAARQWVALALATLWLIEVGGQAQHLHLPRLQLTHGVYRLFRIGLAVILAHLNNSRKLPRGQFQPENWPKANWNNDPLTESQMNRK
jgi:Transposase DDE domain